MTDVIDSTLRQALDLLRRLPPSSVSSNLELIADVCPDIADELFSSVDQPLRVRIDSTPQGAGREYLACDYNRDGDSWRSPWSSLYDPPIDDGTQPSQKLRQLEIKANDAFNTYRQLYFESGLSSVYLWDIEADLAGVILLKNTLEAGDIKGSWDSIHVVETLAASGRSTTYKLTSTIMLRLEKAEKRSEDEPLELAGSLTRQVEQTHAVPEFDVHIANIGRMIEANETQMRGTLQNVYFGKTQDIASAVRSIDSLDKRRKERELQQELLSKWKR